jgi:vacuolar protein sorting-associated protein 13A/C
MELIQTICTWVKNSILGVWNGDIIIENVELNPNILDNLDFPLKLLFSSIGQLKIQVPWTKLGSQPVEIFI